MTHRVFVYGTLLSGFENHDMVLGHEATLVATTTTANAHYRMVDVGYFPGVYLDGDSVVFGEVYDVDDETMGMLDALEGFPRLYSRAQVQLENGMLAWMYIYNYGRPGMREIDDGDYRAYRRGIDAAEDARSETVCGVCDERFHEEDVVITQGTFHAHQRCHGEDNTSKEGTGSCE